MQDSTLLRVQFLESERLTSEHGHAIDQGYLQKTLSQTRHVVCVRPRLAVADVGRNADGTLYVQLKDTKTWLGVEISRVRLHDPGGYMASLGDADWVENLLRFAITREALQVVFTYDSMRQDMDEVIVDGFGMLDVSQLLGMCDPGSALSTHDIADDVLDAVVPDSAAIDDCDVFCEGGDIAADDSVLVV
eukprot:2431931-Rhodomonas_salina.1